jgi:hypothetical protein
MKGAFMRNILVVGLIVILSAFTVTAQETGEPNWSMLYDFSLTPEANGFTRKTHVGTPTANFITRGNPFTRRIEIDSTSGDLVFLTSSVPSLHGETTAEFTVAVNGAPEGNAGLELTFLDTAISMMVYPARMQVLLCGNQSFEVATASNAPETVWRTTLDGSNLRVYRAGVLVFGPVGVPTCSPYKFQRFLWWVEEGAIVTIRKVAYYIAGAVAP